MVTNMLKEKAVSCFRYHRGDAEEKTGLLSDRRAIPDVFVGIGRAPFL